MMGEIWEVVMVMVGCVWHVGGAGGLVMVVAWHGGDGGAVWDNGDGGWWCW